MVTTVAAPWPVYPKRASNSSKRSSTKQSTSKSKSTFAGQSIEMDFKVDSSSRVGMSTVISGTVSTTDSNGKTKWSHALASRVLTKQTESKGNCVTQRTSQSST